MGRARLQSCRQAAQVDRALALEGGCPRSACSSSNVPIGKSQRLKPKHSRYVARVNSCPSTRHFMLPLVPSHSSAALHEAAKIASRFLQLRSDRTLRRPVLRNDSAALAEAVGFSAPEKSAAAEAGQPGKEAQQITNGIEPREVQGAPIADDSPSYRDRLHDPVHEGGREESNSQRPVSHRRCRDQVRELRTAWHK